jgi:hypothetical protein
LKSERNNPLFSILLHTQSMFRVLGIYNFGVGVNFRPYNKDCFLSGRP